MNIVFDKPNAAFHAYERSLLRPIARPAPRDTPSLWSRAREMFGVMMESARAVTQLVVRFHLSRAERRDILTRLKPVEKLTRQLLIGEAATLLLMTPEGMKLRREARIIALPVRTPVKPPPPKGALITGSKRLVIQGLYAPPTPAPRAPATKPDANDPKTWRCSFRVMHWVHPEDDEPRTRPRKSGPRPRAFSFDDIVAFRAKPERSTPARDDGAGAALARRIEALSRILTNPTRAIRRIARFLASLPREALDPPDHIWIDMRGWHHGRNEARAAHDLSNRALTVFNRLRLTDFDGPAPEPG